MEIDLPPLKRLNLTRNPSAGDIRESDQLSEIPGKVTVASFLGTAFFLWLVRDGDASLGEQILLPMAADALAAGLAGGDVCLLRSGRGRRSRDEPRAQSVNLTVLLGNSGQHRPCLGDSLTSAALSHHTGWTVTCFGRLPTGGCRPARRWSGRR